MNGIYRNSEGCYDPTAGEALSEIIHEERAQKRHCVYRPLVFICSRYAGDVESNVHLARKYCRFAVWQNAIPIAPHLLFPQFMDDGDPEERKLALLFGKVLMDRCGEVWIFSDGGYSEGMRSEYERAVRKGYKIRYFTTDCREVRSHGKGGADDAL